ncbi:hypothetical protein CDD83_1112 [Cordyceps sp. RAO-2017]|nr:hypothetical protein CDD83_1112 [Cordyceps sp. RAO-2017]
MADRGWTTVGHRIPAAQRHGREQEQREREAIAGWDKDDHWPGINKPLFQTSDAKRFDGSLEKIGDLGHGAFGRVDMVKHGGVALARKRIARRRGITIDDLRQEGLTMAKLDHCHVVRLVATYAPKSHELCLLIWPAAVCSLSVLLDDIDSLRLGDGGADETAERLDRLDALHLLGGADDDDMGGDTTRDSAGEDADWRHVAGNKTAPPPPGAHFRLRLPSRDLQRIQSGDGDGRPFDFLCGLLGCVARAMAHCHAQGVRHLDIKPSNILLNPGRVYLADFGISRDVSGQDQTTTDGMPGTERWRAPELYGDDGSSMQLSDMYSLGLVYLAVATVLYNARLADLDKALAYPGPSSLDLDGRLRGREDRLRRHLDKLTAHALVTRRFRFTYEGQETVRARPVLSLIASMVSAAPRARPSARKVDERLSVLGGLQQIYHAGCCRRGLPWLEDRLDRKLRDLAGHRDRSEQQLATLRDGHEQQRARIQALEGMDETPS